MPLSITVTVYTVLPWEEGEATIVYYVAGGSTFGSTQDLVDGFVEDNQPAFELPMQGGRGGIQDPHIILVLYMFSTCTCMFIVHVTYIPWWSCRDRQIN